MPNTPLLLYSRPDTRELMRRRWRLVVVDGDDRGITAELEETPALIGAAPAAALMLTDDTVSRYHAELDVFADGIRIRDLDSTNGTFLEGENRVREGFVENGGTFRVGRTTVRALAVDEPASSEIPTDPALHSPEGVVEIGGALAASPLSIGLVDDLRRVAASSSPVLFRGERGAGKSTLARVLHTLSNRARAPFITVNAGEMGWEDHHRLFVKAHRGSLFIEDVDQLSPEVQVILRTAVERGEVRPPGDDKMLRVDVRLLSATTIDLRKKPDFDPVLLRRLAVVELSIAPLRERVDDAAAIAQSRLDAFGLRVGPKLHGLLARHGWPGNIDELEAALDDPLNTAPPAGIPHALQGALLDDAVSSMEGDVSALAKKLALSTRTLFGRLAEHDVDLDLP